MKNFADALEAMKIDDGEKTSVKLNFFGKTWDVKVDYHKGISIPEANKQIDLLVKNGAKLSREIESEFCKYCEDTMATYTDDDECYPIKKYSDIKNESCYSWAALSVKGISAVDMYDRKNKCKSGKIGLIVFGDFPYDPEHGWSFGFCDGRWNGIMRDFIDYIDVF